MIRLFRFLPTRWWSPNAWRNWMSYLHWRMETYGVYYPGGRFNREAFRSMWRQIPSYLRWLSEIQKLRP